MHRVVLLLACVYAVYGHELHYPLKPPSHHATRIPAGPLVSDFDVLQFPEPSRTSPSLDDFYTHYDQTHINQFESREGLENEAESLDSTTRLQIPTRPWAAPPYNRSLKNIDEGLAVIESHFTEEAFNGRDYKKFRYILIMHVVDLLSKEVARKGWASYNNHYPSLVKKYIYEAELNPRNAARLFQCEIVQPLLNGILKARLVIKNQAVQFVCTAEPSTCDAAIWAVIQTSSVDTRRAADVLLAAGNAASTFLKSFASAFDAMSGQNVLKYLLESKEVLRPLVSVDARARKAINPRGERICNVS